MNFWTFADRNAWGVLAVLGILLYFGTIIATASIHATGPCVCPSASTGAP